MKLNDIGQSSPKKANMILESRFGFKINFDNLTIEKADRLLGTVNEGLNKIRMSNKIHTAERDPRYMELLVIKEGIEGWLDQQYITESEVGAAESLLAAKDFVDRLQGMIEDLSQMLNEDLPPLGDSIKDQIGVEQAAAFVTSATETLNALLAATKASRETMDQASRSLAGQEAPAMAPGAAPEAEMPADEAEPEAEMPADEAEPEAELPELPDLDDEDEGPVGRERR